ncbi:hypothetical protein ROR02_20880 [Pararhodospirillum oryzae]|uniref:Uncharacterized protein n=1 Tax=Pararhodospirillum oryzae TaxID=478448 RepID=A0A512H914_9PROT|nr:hypothetical protein ROR02_20880 [Pararhodospirillum oryzae]
MRSTADCAAQSDPEANRQFRRRWEHPTNTLVRPVMPRPDEDVDRLAVAVLADWRARKDRTR